MIGDVPHAGAAPSPRGRDLDSSVRPTRRARDTHAKLLLRCCLTWPSPNWGCTASSGRARPPQRGFVGPLRRLGMREEAHLVENDIFKGEWSDEAVFAVLEDEWNARRPQYTPPDSGDVPAPRPPLPPFTAERASEGPGCRGRLELARPRPRRARLHRRLGWRNRSEFVTGRDEIRAFLARKWERELDYGLRKDLWAFTDDRIAVRFQYEWHDAAGQWWRSYGNENWEFDEHGLMRRREASINDVAIAGRGGRIHGPRAAGDGPRSRCADVDADGATAGVRNRRAAPSTLQEATHQDRRDDGHGRARGSSGEEDTQPSARDAGRGGARCCAPRVCRMSSRGAGRSDEYDVTTACSGCSAGCPPATALRISALGRPRRRSRERATGIDARRFAAPGRAGLTTAGGPRRTTTTHAGSAARVGRPAHDHAVARTAPPAPAGGAVSRFSAALRRSGLGRALGARRHRPAGRRRRTARGHVAARSLRAAQQLHDLGLQVRDPHGRRRGSSSRLARSRPGGRLGARALEQLADRAATRRGRAEPRASRAHRRGDRPLTTHQRDVLLALAVDGVRSTCSPIASRPIATRSTRRCMTRARACAGCSTIRRRSP